MNKLSVVILTKNGMPTISKTLKSVSWADEILVVDSGSADKTIFECKKYKNCRVIETHWRGFSKQHYFGVVNAKYDWILNIDQDEIVSNELSIRIQSLLSQKRLKGAFRIKRYTFYVLKLIKHSWSHDYPVRFFNKSFDNFKDESIPHEYVVGKSIRIKIQEPIIHYCYNSFTEHIDKISFYAKDGALYRFKKGKTSSLSKSILRGLFMFFKMYFLRRGFLDGKTGLALAVNSGFYSYLKYLNLWELNKKGRDGTFHKT